MKAKFKQMRISRNYLLLGLLSLSFIPMVLSCGGTEEGDLMGNWFKVSSFRGVARTGAAAFSIGNTGYVLTGLDEDDDYWKDMFRYISETDDWQQCSDFPGVARKDGVAFATSTNGYVGLGYNDAYLKDFWEYDPVNNSWTAQADFMGSARRGAIAFAIDGIGYVGTGYDGNSLMDFYAFDPSAGELGTWTPKINYKHKKSFAVSFVIDGKGYVCTGVDNGEYLTDFYYYDPAEDIWVALREIGNDESDDDYDDDYTIIRQKAVAFVMNGLAYVATGSTGSNKNDVWEYNPATDLWKSKTTFEGSTRTDAVAFSTASGRAFVTTGTSGSNPFDDTWEFLPNDEYEEDD